MLLPVPVFLVFHYQPLLPIYFDPFILLLGTAMLWTTRFTHRIGQDRSQRYMVFSGIIRPLSILVLSFGWLEILAWDRNTLDFFGDWQIYFILVPFLLMAFIGFFRALVFLFWLVTFIALAMGKWCVVIYGGMFVAFFLFGFWSILYLGIRTSLLFRRPDDPIKVNGPYSVVRHPQLLAAIGMSFSASWMRGSSWGLFNAVIFGFMILFLVWEEERDLVFGSKDIYRSYRVTAPRLIPTISRLIYVAKHLWKHLPGNGSSDLMGARKVYKTGGSWDFWAIIACIIFVLTMIAIPDFMRFQASASMNIAVGDLKTILRFQQNYHHFFGTYYDGSHRLIDAEIEVPQNHLCYTWFVGPGYVATAKKDCWGHEFPSPTESELAKVMTDAGRPDLIPRGDKDHFVSVVAGNLDDDPCMDIWYITEEGKPYNLINDRDTPCPDNAGKGK
ncbi:MAG TPA: hypothetical protein VM658_12075 [bacterium]|nr:hypothetical protein [bacterium]